MARGTGARSFLRLGHYLRRASINKGLFGEDRFWRVVFAVIFGRKLLRRLIGSEPETVAMEKLKPGQFVRIEAIDPEQLEKPAKKKRRKQSA